MQDDYNMEPTTPQQWLRKQFFAFRNGIVAQHIREAGDPHRSIMGCLLADIMTMARDICANQVTDIEQQAQLAQQMWDITSSRECRLVAPMLMPPECMPLDMAMQWCSSVETIEVADVLSHRLLRHLACCDTLMRQLIVHERSLTRYTGYRLLQGGIIVGNITPTPSLKALLHTQLQQSQPPLSTLIATIITDL